VDRIDVAGITGLGLLSGGIWLLAGPAWCLILVGGVLVGLFTVREIRAIVRG
jgi:hypothetical protein